MKGLLTVIQVTRPEPTDTNPRPAEIAQWTERDQIVEDKSIAEQTHEIINLAHALPDAEMKLPEKFLAMSIVNKFSKSWKNFGITLKHQKWRLSLDDLVIVINIEKEYRNQTYKMSIEHQPRANLIVGKQKVNKVNSNSKAFNKNKATKKQKTNKLCWNCGQVGHWAKLCLYKKTKTGQAVNMVVGGSSGASTSGATDGYVSVQLELLTVYEPCDWLIDTEANVRVCADKSLFMSYQAINSMIVSMGNSSTAEVLGMENVDSKFPSERILSLKKTHHVPTVRRNIISGDAFKKRTGPTDMDYGLRLEPNEDSLVKSPSAPGVEGCKESYPQGGVLLGLVWFKVVVDIWANEMPRVGGPLGPNILLGFDHGPSKGKSSIIRKIFPMKTGLPSSVSLDDSLASTSIPEHVEKMSNVGVNLSSTSLTHEESDELRRSVMASSEAKQWNGSCQK
ncbi:hypothetical protein Sango_2789800 [Sesamum angolense]|uniref:CCHC-type domain-containing protein n=1 Tax=Sesamum angolense TaxID=2727404 RepID=A0AAE1T886_9LAMI|nr:hypothetical protein Sango_2789800 [Sesamum angolense]